jgi:protein involved in sex pheromone biosynthesis
MKNRIVIASCAAVLLLSGCGVAETASVAATEAEAAAKQVEEGKKMEQKVQDDIAASQKAERDARDAAEAANN